MTSIRSYSELALLPTFEERFQYLKLNGRVSEATFGSERWLNQDFYHRDDDWLEARDWVIIRDNGCDLGIEGHEILGWTDPVTKKYYPPTILVHHMNPLTKEDIVRRTKYLLDPEYLICTILNTHNAIHYGDINLLVRDPIVRKPHDTCPWRH